MAAALLLLFGFSAGLCVLGTPLARALAIRCGLTDKPDGFRKTHVRPTPLAGGVAILSAACGALAAALLAPTPLREILADYLPNLTGLLLATAVIVSVGLLDDRCGLKAAVKLLGQLAAVALVIRSGVMVRSVRLFDWDWELGLFAVPLTALWLLGTVNSLNLLDGMDGMLSCLGLVVSAAMAVMAVLVGQWGAACVAAALAGALLGFLRYNFPPASIFLGDAGSMLIGLVVGVLAIQSSLKGPATIGLAVPVAVLTLPFFDTAAAIVRRKLRGLSFATPDRGHLHHCLQRRGLSSRRALLWVAGFSLLTGLGALASLAFNSELFAVLSALAVVIVLVTTRAFGYVELVLIRDRVLLPAVSLCQGWAHGGGRRPTTPRKDPGEWKELWQSLTANADHLRLKAVRLDVRGSAILQGYHAHWDQLDDRAPEADLWRAEIPLSVEGREVGRLEIVGRQDQAPIWQAVTAVAKLVEGFEGRKNAPEAVAEELPLRRAAPPSFAARPGPVFSE